MDKQKLMHQLFIGKVAEIIGHEKTVELLREAKTAIDAIEPHLPLADVSRCDHNAMQPIGTTDYMKCLKCGYAWRFC